MGIKYTVGRVFVEEKIPGYFGGYNKEIGKGVIELTTSEILDNYKMYTVFIVGIALILLGITLLSLKLKKEKKLYK